LCPNHCKFTANVPAVEFSKIDWYIWRSCDQNSVASFCTTLHTGTCLCWATERRWLWTRIFR